MNLVTNYLAQKFTVAQHITNWQTHEGKSTHIKGS